jgi:hypothetical protein
MEETRQETIENTTNVFIIAFARHETHTMKNGLQDEFMLRLRDEDRRGQRTMQTSENEIAAQGTSSERFLFFFFFFFSFFVVEREGEGQHTSNLASKSIAKKLLNVSRQN